MEQVIHQIQALDLTGSQEQSLLRGQARVLTYNQLNSLETLLSGPIALLFPTSSEFNSGHWLAIWPDARTRTIHHFDSYGLPPSAELRYSSNADVKQEVLNTLYTQAQQQGWTLKVNTFRLQQMGGKINTCGRHVICRLRMRYLDEAQYGRLMMGQRLSPDDIVTYLTLLALDEDEHSVGLIMRASGSA